MTEPTLFVPLRGSAFYARVNRSLSTWQTFDTRTLVDLPMLSDRGTIPEEVPTVPILTWHRVSLARPGHEALVVYVEA